MRVKLNAGATSETTEHDRRYPPFAHPFMLTVTTQNGLLVR